MYENLFEVEKWRGNWFYKFGGQYTGPFIDRDDAILAASWELSPLQSRYPTSMRATLADLAVF